MMNFFNAFNIFFTNFKIAGGINYRKPLLFNKFLKGYLNAHFNKQKPSLRFMDIALSYACNFNCHHCSAESLIRPGLNNLSLDEYRQIAREASDLGVLATHFTGGEPLLYKNLFDVVQVFNPDKTLISIQTNGWLVDDNFIKDYKEIGGDILCLSIDSGDPTAHDQFRGQAGAWRKAVEVAKMVQKAKLQLLISYTLTHQNIRTDDFSKMIQLTRDLGANLSINLAVPAGKWKGDVDHLLDKDDRLALNRILKKYHHVRTDFESNWKIRGCPAFKEKCYLTPYGDVLPCPFIHISFGNVRQKSLQDIRRHALSFSYLNTYHSVCIAAEDNYFIQNAGCYNIDSNLLPLEYSQSAIFLNKNADV